MQIMLMTQVKLRKCRSRTAIPSTARFAHSAHGSAAFLNARKNALRSPARARAPNPSKGKTARPQIQISILCVFLSDPKIFLGNHALNHLFSA
jgi:hypothetical protein